MKVRFKLQVRPPLDDAISGYFLQLGKPNTLGAHAMRTLDEDGCVTFELNNMKEVDMDAAAAAKVAGVVSVENAGSPGAFSLIWQNASTPPTYVQRNV